MRSLLRVMGLKWRASFATAAVSWLTYACALAAEQYFGRDHLCWYRPKTHESDTSLCETYLWHWAADSMWSTEPAYEYVLRTDHLLYAVACVPLVLWVIARGLPWLTAKDNDE